VQRQGHHALGLQAEPKEQGRQKLDNQINGGGAPIIVVKLLRTDTTLDLSQKARVVRILESGEHGLYRLRWSRTDHVQF
jgi:hypothetical protein